VRVTLSNGPARERLQDPLVRRALSDALSKALARPVVVTADDGEGEGPSDAAGRVTAETVREGRLRRLLELEPILGAAVQELDLELLE
jgi:hypothetical protein